MKKQSQRGVREGKPGPIKTRPARPADAAHIADLSKQLGYPVSTREMESRIRTVTRRKIHKIFVAERDGRVTGWVEVFRPLSVLNWGKGEVGALVVESRNRRSGIGRCLIQTARTWAEDQGCKFVYLRSNIKRKDAHKFYRSTGFTVYKTQFVFRLLLGKNNQRIPS
jgi:N-acetylglutamate synthase-like GNAT family acetyltransferase